MTISTLVVDGLARQRTPTILCSANVHAIAINDRRRDATDASHMNRYDESVFIFQVLPTQAVIDFQERV